MTNTSPYTALRDTISGVVQEYTPEVAQQFLDHPVFGLRLEIVKNTKSQALVDPFIFDASGEKIFLESDEYAHDDIDTVVSEQAPEPAKASKPAIDKDIK